MNAGSEPIMRRPISPQSNIWRTTCFEGPPTRIHSASDGKSRGGTMSSSQASSGREMFTRFACAWYRFEFRWTDPENGMAQTQAGMQAYRIEHGKLAETWISLLPEGSTWPDPVAQETWTSP